jgi:hypothetical protein
VEVGRRKVALLLVSTVATLMGTLFNAAMLKHDEPIPDSVVTHVPWNIPPELEDGDLVFRTGRDFLTRIVLTQGTSPRFSHVGVIIKINGIAFVVHSVPADGSISGGVLLEELQKFIAPSVAADVGFFRIKAISQAARARTRDYALAQVGKPFDSQFKYSDDSSFYCTELVIKSLEAAGVDIKNAVESVNVVTIDEPVFPPDKLAKSDKILPFEVTTRSR